MDPKIIIEAALLSAGQPLNVDRLLALFDESERPPRDEVRRCVDTLREEWADRGVELVEVSSGYRLQVKQSLAPWLSRLWEERRPRYSRALMETLALIAYRQPITRAEIEDVRGVAVSSHIIKTLLDRDWVRIVGHRDVPGRPALLGTTRQFLDQFNLKSLAELPALAEISSLEHIQVDLELEHEAADDESAEDQAAHDEADATGAPEEDGSHTEENADVDTHYSSASNG
jgi:segregation and condensation protein B